MNRDRKTIAFMGGKKVGHACLKFLLDNSTLLKAEVVCVFENNSKLQSDSDSVGQLAQNHNLPVYYDQNKLLEIDNLDFIISVQYNEILKQKHINQAKELAVNLHMAPVPEYRGCNQFSFAIIDNAKEFGTSLHRLEVSIDGGDLIAEKRFEIPQNCFVQDLYKITLDNSISLFEEEIVSILNGDFKLVSQQELAKNRKNGFHLRREVNEIKRIDNTWPIEQQKRYFRATWFPPFSPPTEKQSGKELDLDWYNSLA
jgi:methionyl-tRNA formyltransferase